MSIKAGDAVRVKAGITTMRRGCTPTGTPCYPRDQQVGVKLQVADTKYWIDDGDTVVYFPSCSSYGDGISEQFLEPWNDDEVWNGTEWVKKPLTPKVWPAMLSDALSMLSHNEYIVIRSEGDKLLPSSNPFKHDSLESAKAEAARLAIETGLEFKVFGLVVTHKKPKPKFPELKQGAYVVVKQRPLRSAQDITENVVGLAVVLQDTQPHDDLVKVHGIAKDGEVLKQGYVDRGYVKPIEIEVPF